MFCDLGYTPPMRPIIRLYKPEDFEAITRLWFDAQTVAMPEMMARMAYEFEDAQNYFSQCCHPRNPNMGL